MRKIGKALLGLVVLAALVVGGFLGWWQWQEKRVFAAARELQEKVFDVVWDDTDQRAKGANGKLPPVGDTVDIAKASYSNSIGDPELRTVWADPEFDPAIRAFYYVRVLEIPTPRWVLFDALR